jgi:hypothetical protein
LAKVRYREGLAPHSAPSGGIVSPSSATTLPESCAGICEDMGEALAGADVSLIGRTGTAGDRNPIQGSDSSLTFSQLSTNP